MLEALSRTQQGVAEELKRTTESGMLPQSLLFSGPKGSSRLTGALDLAFFLTGEESSRSTLRSGRIVYIASRNLEVEANAALSLFERQRNERSRNFLIQTLRKVLLQYHSSVAELYGNRKINVKLRDEEGRGGSLFSNAEAVDAVLMDLEDMESISEKESIEIVSELRSRLVSDFFTLGKKTAGATIDEIRLIQDWLEEGIEEKCVIIENPEDFTEGAKNSMLKMLEEPPKHSHLILLSLHPGRILQTILSRVRRFDFPELNEKTVSSLIGEIFSIYGNYRSFDSFFFEEGTDDEDRNLMKDITESYYRALIEGRMLPLDEENRIFSSLEKLSGYEYFRSLIIGKLEKELAKGGDAKRIRKAWTSLSSAVIRSDTYNMSIRTALDMALREVTNGK